jgi:hypothetical protein
MRLSALRLPSFKEARLWKWLGKAWAQRSAARTDFYFVIAGLDPAIHSGARPAEDPPDA